MSNTRFNSPVKTLIHTIVHITCGTSVLSGAWESKKMKYMKVFEKVFESALPLSRR
jgi:hypothetical protein